MSGSKPIDGYVVDSLKKAGLTYPQIGKALAAHEGRVVVYDQKSVQHAHKRWQRAQP